MEYPEWVKWVATDPNGSVWCFDSKPEAELCWINKGGRNAYRISHGKGPVENWRETLREIKPAADLKQSNPKDLIGADKVPMHLWPNTATVLGAMGLLDGALKYGRSNFRAVGVRASIYYDAARRHLDRWFEGEDLDPDSGLPHLAHALASIAIVVDAKAAGKLNDDRMVPGGYHELLAELTPMVAALKAKHADKAPKHYTIEDNQC